MKKIVSNVLIVSTQLIVGGLFLFMLFSDSNEDNRVVVIENNNLDKMADAVSELFVVDHVVNDTTVQEEVVLSNGDEIVEEVVEEVKPVQEEVVETVPVVVETPAPVVQEPVVETPPPVQNTVTVDATGYISNPAVGFNVTTGNRTYSLSDEQFSILAAVVNCEANRSSKDDILGVMSVILNRADSSRYPNDPVSVVAQPYQFSCYKGQGAVVSDTVAGVIRDALNGVRNNSFYSFNAWHTNRSQNYIVTGGNRYF